MCNKIIFKFINEEELIMGREEIEVFVKINFNLPNLID